MTDLAKLVVKLEAQTAQYQGQLEKAQRANQKFSDKAKSSFSAVRAGYVAMAAGVVGAFASIKQGIDRQADLFDLSTRLGATTEGLSRLQYAAEQSGVSLSTLNMGLQRMVRRVAEASNGTGEAAGALEELNISAEKLNQLRPEEQFNVLADAIMKVENPADRVRIAMKLFDSEGVALIQTMQGGSAQLAQFGAEADRFGVTVGQSAAEGAKRASGAMTQLGAVFTGTSNVLAAQFAPEMELMAAFLAENVPKAVNFAKQAFLVLQRGFVNFALQLVKVRIKFNEFVGDLEEADRLRNTSEVLQQMVNDLGAKQAALASTSQAVGAYGERVQKVSYDVEQYVQVQRDANETIKETVAVAQKASSEIPAFWQEAQESFEVAQQAVQEPIENGQTAIDKLLGPDSIKSIFTDFQNIEERFKQLIANMLAEALAAQVSKALLGGLGGLGGGGGLFGGLLGGLFGGARAMGGPVAAGKVHLVGERGPELYVPNTAGHIVPNHQLGGNVNIHMTVNANDADSFKRSQRQIENQLYTAMMRGRANA